MNIRYKNLSASVAGDEDQFLYSLFSTLENNNINNNVDTTPLQCWEKYKNRDLSSVLNTFYYMFYKIKKGVFISIRNGKIQLYLPFTNMHFKNEWGELIKAPSGKQVSDIIRQCALNEGRKWNEKRLNNDFSKWWSNNCLLRYEYPPRETDRNIDTVEKYFSMLCEKEDVPDIDFFVNKRDFPILKRDGTEPYHHIWGTKDKPLISHNYNNYAPILSMVSASDYADVAIPTWDDMEQILTVNEEIHSIEWNRKKDVAIWRGTSTGAGVNENNNIRIKLATLSHSINDTNLLDAGITKWNCRPRKLQDCEYLQIINPDEINIPVKKWLSEQEQNKYKYLICVDGHVTAFRLTRNLKSGSVVLLVGSEWDLWYFDKLKEWEHYIPVKKDLSDLIDKINWCKKNDDKVYDITIRAKKLIDELMSSETHFKHVNNILKSIRNTYNDDVTHMRKILSIKKPNIVKPSTLCMTEVENNSTILFKSKLSLVRLYNIFTVKTTLNQRKMEEHRNEVYIGCNCINNLNSKNFTRTLGWTQDINGFHIFSEYVKGITLQDYIKSSKFVFDEYIKICIQIILSIYEAQERFGFIHGDLVPWNIMITSNTNKEPLVYNMYNGKGLWKMHSKYIARIIDYGKSRVIHDKVFTGYVNVFNSNISSDIISLLVTSLKEILYNRTLSSTDWNKFNCMISMFIKEKLNCRNMKMKLSSMCNYQYLSNVKNDKIIPIDVVNYLYGILSNKDDVKLFQTFEKTPNITLKDTKCIFENIRDENDFIVKIYKLQMLETYYNTKESAILNNYIDVFNDFKTTYKPEFYNKFYPSDVSFEVVALSPNYYKQLTSLQPYPVKNESWYKSILNTILLYPEGKKFSIPPHVKKEIYNKYFYLLNTPSMIMHHNEAITLI